MQQGCPIIILQLVFKGIGFVTVIINTIAFYLFKFEATAGHLFKSWLGLLQISLNPDELLVFYHAKIAPQTLGNSSV